MKDAFAKFGDVQDVKIVTDRETGRPRGFAFVTLSDPSEAEEAVRSMVGFSLNNREIRVDRASRKDSSNRGGSDSRSGYRGGDRDGGDRGRYGGGDRGERSSGGPCYAFQKGECRFGDRCRYSHEGGSSNRSYGIMC